MQQSKDRLKEKGSLDRLRQTVKDAMSPHNTRDEFRRLLKADNIDAIFRINPVGRIYGVTFIDHNGRCRRQRVGAGKRVLGKCSSTNCIRHRKRCSRLQNSNNRNRNNECNTMPQIPFQESSNTLLDLADTKAYEEQQRQMQQRRKKRRHRS